MALTLTYNGHSIQPVYSVIPWVITNSDEVDYFLIDVYPNGYSKVTQQLLQDGSSAEFDLGAILQGYFSSDANQTVDASLIQYTVVGKSFIRGVETSTLYTTKNLYVYNGVDNGSLDVSSFIIDASTENRKILNKYNADRYIHYDVVDQSTKLTIEVFSGIFNIGQNSSINNLTVTKYGSGDVSIFNLGYTATPSIRKIDISPKTLNIPYGTNYYTVSVSTNRSETIKVNVNSRDNRYNKYYRLIWVDSNGATDAFNFDLAYQNEIDIKKQEFKSNYKTKVFNTEVEDIYTITSNWITESEAIALKELWHSPDIKACTPPISYVFKPIILDVNNIEIKERRSDRLINYRFSFKYADEYKIQKS